MSGLTLERLEEIREDLDGAVIAEGDDARALLAEVDRLRLLTDTYRAEVEHRHRFAQMHPVEEHPDEFYIKKFLTGYASVADMQAYVAERSEFIGRLVRQREALRATIASLSQSLAEAAVKLAMSEAA